MKIDDIIHAFGVLGNEIDSVLEKGEGRTKKSKELGEAIENCQKRNPWFIPEFIKSALKSYTSYLSADEIGAFLGNYDIRKSKVQYTVAVISAGNIPLVGFHDFFCVLLSGHNYLGKLSSDDNELLPLLAEMLIEIEPEFVKRIAFIENSLKDFDAVIATGSNNTMRYFNYYFSSYPHIFRHNRSGVAILNGTETGKELSGLADDLLLYFGLGCRNVSKIFVPNGFSFDILRDSLEKYAFIANHNKYSNNLVYNKALMMLDSKKFIDMGVLLLREDKPITSPVSVIHFEYYSDFQEVENELKYQAERIQCVVSTTKLNQGSILPSQTQHPAINEFADNVDTMDFLLQLM